MKLIDNWQKAWKFWSLRLGIIGTAITSVFLASPDAALYAWAILPDDLKSTLHPDLIRFVGVFVLIASFGARVVKQPKIDQ